MKSWWNHGIWKAPDRKVNKIKYIHTYTQELACYLNKASMESWSRKSWSVATEAMSIGNKESVISLKKDIVLSYITVFKMSFYLYKGGNCHSEIALETWLKQGWVCNTETVLKDEKKIKE